MQYNPIIFANYPRGQDWPTPINNHCDQPFRVVNIDLEGDCYVCQCEAHLPVSVGNITDFDRLQDVWTNPIAIKLQQTILDRSYTYCAVQHCGIINADHVMNRYQIGINIDESCNLSCPSCRRQSINHTSGPLYHTRLAKVMHLIDLVNQFTEPVHIVMSGNGDPLASAIMRPLLLNWQPKNHQTIKLHTNGLLMKKLLPTSSILEHISEFHISVDAGSESVYEVVRRPGKFDALLENLEWLRNNRPRNAQVTLLFVVSAMNVSSIVPFADLCQRYGFTGEYTKLDNWGTFDNFDSQDVSRASHPMHSTMCQQLALVAEKSHVTISPFLKKFIKTN